MRAKLAFCRRLRICALFHEVMPLLFLVLLLTPKYKLPGLFSTHHKNFCRALWIFIYERSSVSICGSLISLKTEISVNKHGNYGQTYLCEAVMARVLEGTATVLSDYAQFITYSCCINRLTDQ